MKLTHVRATNYRSLRDVELDIEAVNLFIGANAAGKSNLLDALAFLHEGVLRGDFHDALRARGQIVHLAWKGEPAKEVSLEAQFADGEDTYRWVVNLRRAGYAADVVERVEKIRQNKATVLLEADGGRIWWKTDQAKTEKLHSTRTPTVCALAEAATDERFAGRRVAQFVSRWGFFDPSPSGLRRAAAVDDDAGLWSSAGNLAARLHALKTHDLERFERIRKATHRVLGVPDAIDFNVSEDGKVYFLQRESGLSYQVHQVGASSGTLRMLALMTALYGETEVALVGIEEPENYVHPKALEAFAAYLRDATESGVQLAITTHSPLFLDCFAKPGEVVVVKRTPNGTSAERLPNPKAIDEALEESGFGLGQFFESQGFGA